MAAERDFDTLNSLCPPHLDAVQGVAAAAAPHDADLDDGETEVESRQWRKHYFLHLVMRSPPSRRVIYRSYKTKIRTIL